MAEKKQVGEAQLKDAGLKITVPRIKILQVLEQAPAHHLSAEDVYKELMKNNEEISLATVYRVLTQFEKAGLIQRQHFEGVHSVFELMQDEHHDHLVCMECGKVEEFVDEIIEDRQKKIAHKFGFEMIDHALNIYGICPKCQTTMAG